MWSKPYGAFCVFFFFFWMNQKKDHENGSFETLLERISMQRFFFSDAKVNMLDGPANEHLFFDHRNYALLIFSNSHSPRIWFCGFYFFSNVFLSMHAHLFWNLFLTLRTNLIGRRPNPTKKKPTATLLSLYCACICNVVSWLVGVCFFPKLLSLALYARHSISLHFASLCFLLFICRWMCRCFLLSNSDECQCTANLYEAHFSKCGFFPELHRLGHTISLHCCSKLLSLEY